VLVIVLGELGNGLETIAIDNDPTSSSSLVDGIDFTV
jgi:hypothetical protein